VTVALAVDGGNSKTDLALVDAAGGVLAVVRGAQSSPHHLGLEGSLDVLERLLEEACGRAGLTLGREAVAGIGQFQLAGVDFPSEESEFRSAVERRGWVEKAIVGNDTFAVLRAGTERGWGVAVVCGAGINCVGVAPDGRQARFPALGSITGDWGGGYDVGLAALSAAARSEDGRGPKTSLERSVPAHFGLRTPLELAEAIHRKQIAMHRVVELAPLVFAADGDGVAAGIVEQLVAEIVALARVALTRLDLTQSPAEVLLGGGLLQSADGSLTEAIEAGLREVGPDIAVHRATAAPVVGAALLALDELASGPEAQRRLRTELGEATAKLVEAPRG
jgi:N-acetylglucosamine kinase-like BadF-type ATPase